MRGWSTGFCSHAPRATTWTTSFRTSSCPPARPIERENQGEPLMSDDRYLWDGSGPPDPEVERLEDLLGRFRHDRPALSWQRRRPSLRVLAVAAVLALAAAGALWIARAGGGWNVRKISGAP